VYEAVREKNFEKAEILLENLLPLFRIVGEFMKKRETVSIIPPAYRTNYMYMSVGKACMDLVGLSGGPLKLPMENLKDEEKNELKKVLKEIGII
jgi:dihydrodipicolinate synthase/N-acetylneuraminate lyase